MPEPATPNSIIDVAGVSKRYGRTLALDQVSLGVAEGELFALLGPNGAGKTTLVHILVTIHPPDGGHASVAGFDIQKSPLAARKRIGVVFQDSTLDTRLTSRENLDFHGRIYGVPASVRRKRIEEMLVLVELSEWADHLVRSLSSGMKRRLEIARSLIHDSRILFLDEPTVGLDAQSRSRIWEYIHRLRRERELTVLVTTHYIEEVESCDRVCIIDQGQVLALDSPKGLKAAHGQELLRVVPRDEGAHRDIVEQYRDQVTHADGTVLLRPEGETFVETFLQHHSHQIRELTVEKPSLESVFLSLTGREIRDRAADPRERTLAFGKQGGEHTQ